MKQLENGAKQCSACKEIKNVMDFCKDRTRSDGLEARCRDCHSKKNKKYQKEHKLELVQYGIEYNKTHKEQKSEYYKQYWQKNKQECQEYNKEYWNQNKEELSVKNKEWRKKCKSEGRCTSCGNINDDTKFSFCSKCRIKVSTRVKSKENRIKRNIYESNKMKTDILYRTKKLLRDRLNKALKGNYKVGSAVRDLGCSIEEFKIYLENQFLPGMTWENWGCGENDWQLDHIKPIFMFDLTDREQFLEVCHYTNLRPLWRIDNLARTYEEIKA
jgi:hypothetical protein